jgi:hypothetical protein
MTPAGSVAPLPVLARAIREYGIEQKRVTPPGVSSLGSEMIRMSSPTPLRKISEASTTMSSPVGGVESLCLS